MEGEFENTKGVIRIHISKKNRQHNGQKKKDKQRSTKHTYKTKDRVTRTPLKTGVELRCSGRVGSFCSTCGTRRVNLVKTYTLECTYCAVGIRSLSHMSDVFEQSYLLGHSRYPANNLVCIRRINRTTFHMSVT